MLLKLRNVRFSVFDPGKEKWIEKENMAVLVTEDYIYAVESSLLYYAAEESMKKDKSYSADLDREKITKLLMAHYDKKLVNHIISRELQGKIYSKNVLWKAEYEEKPYYNMGGDIE